MISHSKKLGIFPRGARFTKIQKKEQGIFAMKTLSQVKKECQIFLPQFPKIFKKLEVAQ